jgi:hypothetical protein
MTACWTKPRCAQFLWKNRVTWLRMLMEPSRALLRIHTSFAHFKHLYIAWVAEAGSFHCGIVGNCRRLSTCVYSFQLSAVFHMFIFQHVKWKRRCTKLEEQEVTLFSPNCHKFINRYHINNNDTLYKTEQTLTVKTNVYVIWSLHGKKWTMSPAISPNRLAGSYELLVWAST